MTSVISIIFPIYAAIALGFALVKFQVFTIEEIRTLGKYVLNIALPALVFHAIASRPIADVFVFDYGLVYLLGGLAVIAMTYVIFAAQKAPPMVCGLATMGVSCPNNGFVGYAVMLLVFPDMAGLILALNFIVENLIFVPLSLLILEAVQQGQQTSLLEKLAKVFVNVLKMPLVIGLLLGLLVSLSGITLPQPVSVVFTMFAASASALALLVIGGSLVNVKPTENQGFALQIILGKLLLQPAITFLIFIILSNLNLVSLEDEMLVALLLSAAMPIFAIYAVFGQRFGHAGLASVVLVATTVGAFFSLSALLYLLT